MIQGLHDMGHDTGTRERLNRRHIDATEYFIPQWVYSGLDVFDFGRVLGSDTLVYGRFP